MTWVAVSLTIAASAALAWGWFEAGWLRRRVLEVVLEGVSPELDGLRIAHLSDLHLGAPSRGRRAVEDAFAWVAERRPDLVCITGDLVSRRGGMPVLQRLFEQWGQTPGRVETGHLSARVRTPDAGVVGEDGASEHGPGSDPGGKLPPCFVVLGNHDFADSRDPFSQRIDPAAIEALEGVILLGDESVDLELRGLRVQIVGVDPQTYAAGEAHPDEVADRTACLRVLLCHFPGVVRRIPGVFDLVLAGHFHAGQIVVPFPGGRFRLAHLRAREIEGVYRYGSTALHVSPGLGTTFVPFRFFARPEVTELVVRSGQWRGCR
jgi:predicted MPP superfamily phosphohydrolase